MENAAVLILTTLFFQTALPSLKENILYIWDLSLLRVALFTVLGQPVAWLCIVLALSSRLVRKRLIPNYTTLRLRVIRRMRFRPWQLVTLAVAGVTFAAYVAFWSVAGPIFVVVYATGLGSTQSNGPAIVSPDGQYAYRIVENGFRFTSGKSIWVQIGQGSANGEWTFSHAIFSFDGRVADVSANWIEPHELVITSTTCEKYLQPPESPVWDVRITWRDRCATGTQLGGLSVLQTQGRVRAGFTQQPAILSPPIIKDGGF
jgi:hypothetical protein